MMRGWNYVTVNVFILAAINVWALSMECYLKEINILFSLSRLKFQFFAAIYFRDVLLLKCRVNKSLVKLNRPRHKAIYFSWFGPDFFLSVAWPTGVQLLVFFCSSVPVVLFDTPGISRGRS